MAVWHGECHTCCSDDIIVIVVVVMGFCNGLNPRDESEGWFVFARFFSSLSRPKSQLLNPYPSFLLHSYPRAASPFPTTTKNPVASFLARKEKIPGVYNQTPDGMPAYLLPRHRIFGPRLGSGCGLGFGIWAFFCDRIGFC